ncbi:CGNR zinc finger domain-containing protein [Glaciihabitans tibetensis]|uniref:CGNR zinc finger domain-containing protein n=1 Tax=Glaciihabitans tibetensis TaxID=1266600 RepID=UPI001FE6DDD4|nr:CGNR zinc finger domain-containing protein [Glaciihabitans tibetensis]
MFPGVRVDERRVNDAVRYCHSTASRSSAGRSAASVCEFCSAPNHQISFVLAWAEVIRQHPGRLRPCGNDECRLVLLDRSRPGTAKWCSMATRGNRMKARAHLQRNRD